MCGSCRPFGAQGLFCVRSGYPEGQCRGRMPSSTAAESEPSVQATRRGVCVRGVPFFLPIQFLLNVPALLIAIVIVAHLAWWNWSSRQLPRGASRVLLAAFAIVPLGVIALRLTVDRGPALLWAVGYVWLLSALPVTLLLILAYELCRFVRRPRTVPPQTEPDGPPLTRRRLLATAAVAAPPLTTLAAAGMGCANLDVFRVIRRPLGLPGLPPALVGLRIVHVSDTHVGPFTRGAVLTRLVDAVNALDADLVCFTGDLIDHRLRDLPAAAEMLNAMRGRYGTFAVEGNHDLFVGSDAFRRGCAAHGIDLLVGDARRLSVRDTPLDVLGLRWAGSTDAGQAAAFAELPPVRPGAFPVLLAHHPHAFDAARMGGVPLTLAGHTHGGQMMTPGGLGFGPVMYRYWSGPSFDPGTGHAVVVSNGAGRWFPVRINAPAEITLLTLEHQPPLAPPAAELNQS